MKNGDIQIDNKGKKWIWINGAFYIDDKTLEEAKEKILNLTRDDIEIINKIGGILGKV